MFGVSVRAEKKFSKFLETSLNRSQGEFKIPVHNSAIQILEGPRVAYDLQLFGIILFRKT